MQFKLSIKTMAAFIGVILSLALLAACSTAKKTSAEQPGVSQSVATDRTNKTQTAILYTNKETGSVDAEWGEHKYEYNGELTVEVLADGLSDLTGLDFFVSAYRDESEISIDWAKNSTIIADLDDREQKDEFRFNDADSMRWFMMDSLWRTVTENLKVGEHERSCTFASTISSNGSSKLPGRKR